MRVHIKDVQTLSAVSPIDIATYLKSRKWNKIEDYLDKATVWQFDRHELLLPLDTSISDYHFRVSEILNVLSEIEERSQLLIIKDIRLSNFDVVRVKNPSSEAADGSLPLALGVDFNAGAYDMLISAACAASKGGKAWYPSRKTKEVNEYINNVRMGQTEQGSYIITLLSPTSPEVNEAEPNLMPGIAEPFERKVTIQLADSLAAIKTAARTAMISSNIQPFIDGISNGINANLCDAIRLISHTTFDNGVNIDIAWSRNRKQPRDVVSSIRIDNDLLPVIEEAGYQLKSTSPEIKQGIFGIVVRCQREPDDDVGYITVNDVNSDSLRKVKVALEKDDYEEAVQAHKTGNPVRCLGDVIKEGRRFILENHGPLKIYDNIE